MTVADLLHEIGGLSLLSIVLGPIVIYAAWWGLVFLVARL